MKERIIERIEFVEMIKNFNIMKSQLDTLVEKIKNQRVCNNTKVYIYQYMTCIASINNLKAIVSDHIDNYYERNNKYDEMIMEQILAELKDIVYKETKVTKMMIQEEKDLKAQLGLE